MRVPFKSEADAFRVAMALGLLLGISVLVGVLSTFAYGAVVFAGGLAAGVVYELAGRETEPGPSLSDAAQAPHPHGAGVGHRHILVIANEPLGGDELRDALKLEGGPGLELDVLAPILASRLHRLASDTDRERRDAQERLDASLRWADEQGFVAKGEVGDPDELVSVEDELRDFGADEVFVVSNVRNHDNWLARRMLGHLQRQLDVPVREFLLGAEQEKKAPDPTAEA